MRRVHLCAPNFNSMCFIHIEIPANYAHYHQYNVCKNFTCAVFPIMRSTRLVAWYAYTYGIISFPLFSIKRIPPRFPSGSKLYNMWSTMIRAHSIGKCQNVRCATIVGIYYISIVCDFCLNASRIPHTFYPKPARHPKSSVRRRGKSHIIAQEARLRLHTTAHHICIYYSLRPSRAH